MARKPGRFGRYREARSLLARLFPSVFPLSGPVPALAPSVCDDMVASLQGILSRDDIRSFLFQWTREADYLHAVAAGGACVRLDGSIHGPIRRGLVDRARVRLARRVPGVLCASACRGGSRPGRRIAPATR